MIYGIGTDLVQIERIAIIYKKYGNHFITRLLTIREQERFRVVTQKKAATYLAKRFAAKEAFVKALGIGFRRGVTLNSIGVHSDELNKPMIHVNTHVQLLLEKERIRHIHLSLSDDTAYAISTVLLEK